MAPLPLPILSLDDFRSPSTRLQFSQNLIHSLQTHGVVQLTHTLPASTLSHAFTMTRTLFSLPPSTKFLAPHPASPLHHRGYSSPGQEKLSLYAYTDTPSPSLPHTQPSSLPPTQSSPPTNPSQNPASQDPSSDPTDLRESYEIGSPFNTHEPNIWLPDEAFPGFRTWALEFFAACHEVAMQLLEAVSIGLGEGEEDGSGSRGNLVGSHASAYNHQLRLLHYPPVERGEVRGGRVVRMGAHCDWSTMTMLFQDECGGLEVEDRKSAGGFVPVPPLENACVLTVGDLLMRWSNDKLKSTLHRVDLPPVTEDANGEAQMTRARYSIPFFVSPHPETTVEPLPACVDATNPNRYEPVKQIAYNRQKMGLQYASN